MKRNLLFDVENTMKRDIMNVKEINKKIAQEKEKHVVNKANPDKIRQTVRTIVQEFLRKHPELPEQWPEEFIIVDTEEKLQALCAMLEVCKRFSYDTETMGLNIWHGDHIVGMSFHTPVDGKSWYIPMKHIETVEPVKQLDMEVIVSYLKPILDKKREESHKYMRRNLNGIEDVDLEEEYEGVVTFNGKFDNHVIYINTGIEMPDIVFEGYLASRVLNENEREPRLKPLCNHYLPQYKENNLDKFDEVFEKTPCAYFPIWMVGYYACKDALITWEWMEYAEAHLKQRKGLAESFYTVQMPVLPSVIESERKGILVDKDRISELKEQFNKYVESIEKTIKAQAQDLVNRFLEENPSLTMIRIPSESAKKEDKFYDRLHLKESLIPNLNINSTQQLAELFYDILGWTYSKKDGRSTSEAIMKKLAKKYPMCKSILDYRTLKKMVSTYCDGLLDAISPVDGRVHTSFNIFGAVTNRFSSSGPNLQNIPSKAKKLLIEGKEVKVDFGHMIRQVFIADEDCVLCSTDYSQIEPRILAVLCGDPTMLDSYRNNKDIYSTQAKLFFPGHEDYEYYDNDDANYKSEFRSKVKAFVLGLNYGMTEVGLAEGLGCTESEAKLEKERYLTTFPRIGEFIENSLKSLYKNGYVEMLYHTKRRIPEIYDHRQWIRSDAERQCVNSIIQGSSAEITKRAMAFIHNSKRLKELGVYLLLTVHDEVITLIPKSCLEEAVEIIKQCMIDACERIVKMGGIGIKVDAEISERWYGEPIHLGGEKIAKEEKLVLEDLEMEEVEEYEESVFA